ncbi:hypothetical protein ABZ565_32995 [Streptomyces sp. NPDC016469]|uniref:hypothetical protein n=1 Tax=Streptomyces sp. NPDC016469 TaxID=3157191 RepID=UPI0033C4C97E
MPEPRSDSRYALILRPSGSFDVIDWPTELAAGLNLLAREFNTTGVATFSMWPGVSLWTYVDAMMHRAAPLNRSAVNIHSASGYHPQEYYGTAAITGGPQRYTYTGLTLDGCYELLKIAGIDVPTMPKPRTK